MDLNYLEHSFELFNYPSTATKKYKCKTCGVIIYNNLYNEYGMVDGYETILYSVSVLSTILNDMSGDKLLLTCDQVLIKNIIE